MEQIKDPWESSQINVSTIETISDLKFKPSKSKVIKKSFNEKNYVGNFFYNGKTLYNPYDPVFSPCRVKINSQYKNNLIYFFEEIYLYQKDFQILKSFFHEYGIMEPQNFLRELTHEYYDPEEVEDLEEFEFDDDFELDLDLSKLENRLYNGIELSNANFVLYCFRGFVYYHLGKYKEAIKDFKNVIYLIKESFIPKLIPNLKISRIRTDKEVLFILEDLKFYHFNNNSRLVDYLGAVTFSEDLTCSDVVNLFDLEFSFEIYHELNFLINQISKHLKIKKVNSDRKAINYYV